MSWRDDQAAARRRMLEKYDQAEADWYEEIVGTLSAEDEAAYLDDLSRVVAFEPGQRVLDAGEKWHGSTVHFVTEELDGGPRILQGRLAVDPEETADELCARVQALEHQIYPLAADWFGQGRLESRDGAAWLDGERLEEPVVRDF